MITIENLQVNYGKFNVLKNLNWSLDKEKIHGLAGLNGSGKTTLFHTMMKLKNPVIGSIKICGKAASRKEMVLLETRNFFYAKITGREYLRLLSYKNPGFDIRGWNELFRLPLKKLIDHYSTGMKKKLAFMGVLAVDKPILLLDEPFNGIDMESNRVIKQIIEILATKGKTIIITSHLMESLTGLCDTISFLHNGNIMFTKEKTHFHEIENEIFSDKKDTDHYISRLLGSKKDQA